MQGQRNTVGSFTETIDINQGSMANNDGSTQQTSSSNLLSPLERFSSFMASSGELSYANAVGHDVQNSTSWHFGESSSGMNLQSQMNDDGMKAEHGWMSLNSAFAGPSPSSEETRFEPTSSHYSGRTNIVSSSQQVTSGSLFPPNSSVNYIPQYVNFNAGCVGSSSNEGHGMRSGGSANLYGSGGLEREQITSDTVMGTSSGSSCYMLENDGGPASSPSLSNWGSSCKRKALEGTSGQSYGSGSSSCFPQSDNSIWNATPARCNSSGSLNLSTPSLNPPSISPLEQQNSRIGFGMRGVPSSDNQSIGVGSSAESIHRNSGRRIILGHQQEPLPLNLSSTRNARLSNVCLPRQLLRQASYSESQDQRSSAGVASSSSGHQRRAHAMRTSDRSRYVHPWQMDPNLRVGSSSNSPIAGDRGTALHEEANIRSIARSSRDHLMFESTAELRNRTRDATNWSLGSGNVNNSVGISSSTQVGPSSVVPPSTAWNSHPSPPLHSSRQFPEIAPWSIFPPPDYEPGIHVSPFSSTTSIPSESSSVSAVPSRVNSQSRHQAHRSSVVLLERHNEDLFSTARSLRALAAGTDGRQRLISEIRQVLNAMRRGENLRAEDYVLFDPLIFHGMAEIHDRHRDMRLDVDNMSYEELLELEERIGNVSTGLSEKTILKRMKQRKHILTYMEPQEDMEPCCVCQEDYADGDDIGTLDCGHDFHSHCIKQWLMQKNICPICKTTALVKEDD